MRQISAMGWHFEIVLVNDSVSSHLYQSFPGKVPVMMEGIKMASKAVEIGATGLGCKATPLKWAPLPHPKIKKPPLHKSAALLCRLHIVTLRSDGGITANVSCWPLWDLLRWAVPHINCPALPLPLILPPRCVSGGRQGQALLSLQT